MKDLLPYFERELVMLRRQGREFAAHYPKLAAQLHMNGDTCADPHVERLIQSSALLAARIAKRLDDDYPLFTTGLLDMLMPHYLRPFPSCSIARFDQRDPRRSPAGVAPVPRGTRLLSPAVNGTACSFQTCYDIPAVPVRLTNAQFAPMISLPTGVFAPPGATSAISISLECIDAEGAADFPLNVFVDGEPTFSAALLDCLFMKTRGAFMETEDGRWIALQRLPISRCGFHAGEALIPFKNSSHPAYRLLTEYFAFPEKFNFFALDLAQLAACARFTLHLMVGGLSPDGQCARALTSLCADNLLLGCAPIVNLFHQHGEPITVTHHETDYTVRAHPVMPQHFEIYTIDSVHYRAQGNGGDLVAVRPFYSLHHGEDPNDVRLFWTSRRDEERSISSPGHETSISLVDQDFDPALPGLATLSLELSCTNRDLPSQLPYGQPDGDLAFAEDTNEIRIRMLRKPSPPRRFTTGAGAHWRLIAHLALNQQALSTDGLPALRELLSLYDLRQSAVSQRQIAGLVELEHAAATTWLRHPRGATLAHGVALRLTIDEDAFVGSGIHAFVQVLAEFLSLYVQANSFVELSVWSHQTGEELIRCKPRNGNLQPA